MCKSTNFNQTLHNQEQTYIPYILRYILCWFKVTSPISEDLGYGLYPYPTRCRSRRTDHKISPVIYWSMIYANSPLRHTSHLPFDFYKYRPRRIIYTIGLREPLSCFDIFLYRILLAQAHALWAAAQSGGIDRKTSHARKPANSLRSLV